MLDEGRLAEEYPGYLVECLVYNVPNNLFGSNALFTDLNEVFNFLWEGLRDANVYNNWLETSELLFLFQGSSRNPLTAFNFIDTAWRKVVED